MQHFTVSAMTLFSPDRFPDQFMHDFA